jgi:ABC-2 type transport system ATP-binding protein
VQIVAALAHRPALLLLDELTDGLDPLAREEVLSLLASHLADTGCTAILSTHLVARSRR